MLRKGLGCLILLVSSAAAIAAIGAILLIQALGTRTQSVPVVGGLTVSSTSGPSVNVPLVVAILVAAFIGYIFGLGLLTAIPTDGPKRRWFSLGRKNRA